MIYKIDVLFLANYMHNFCVKLEKSKPDKWGYQRLFHIVASTYSFSSNILFV